jgi:hypothetical protein
MSIVGTIDTPGTAKDVCVFSDVAFVADYWDGGLQVINVSNPASPTIIDSRGSYGGALGVYAGEDVIEGETYPLLYFADSYMGLYVFEYNVQ